MTLLLPGTACERTQWCGVRATGKTQSVESDSTVIEPGVQGNLIFLSLSLSGTVFVLISLQLLSLPWVYCSVTIV